MWHSLGILDWVRRDGSTGLLSALDANQLIVLFSNVHKIKSLFFHVDLPFGNFLRPHKYPHFNACMSTLAINNIFHSRERVGILQ